MLYYYTRLVRCCAIPVVNYLFKTVELPNSAHLISILMNLLSSFLFTIVSRYSFNYFFFAAFASSFEVFLLFPICYLLFAICYLLDLVV